MIDINKFITSQELNFYSDMSANAELGAGAYYNTHWMFVKWEPNFIKENAPSIEFLELFGVVAAVLMWGHLIQNMRVVVFCNNMAVVSMLNNSVSSCKNCMFLLRVLMLNNLVNGRRVFAKYVKSAKNAIADSLFRLQFRHFWSLVPHNMDPQLTTISPVVWPLSKIWTKI